MLTGVSLDPATPRCAHLGVRLADFSEKRLAPQIAWPGRKSDEYMGIRQGEILVRGIVKANTPTNTFASLAFTVLLDARADLPRTWPQGIQSPTIQGQLQAKIQQAAKPDTECEKAKESQLSQKHRLRSKKPSHLAGENHQQYQMHQIERVRGIP